jgi:hypothetical protein
MGIAAAAAAILGLLRDGWSCGQTWQEQSRVKRTARGYTFITSRRAPYAAYASSRDALRAESDHRAYRPCHRKDGTAGIPELMYRCYHIRAAPLSVTTTARAPSEQSEDGPRRRRRRDPRDSPESAAGRMEQLADVGRSDPASSGLNDRATFREPAGVLRHVLPASARSACLTSSGLPWADSGGPT